MVMVDLRRGWELGVHGAVAIRAPLRMIDMVIHRTKIHKAARTEIRMVA